MYGNEGLPNPLRNTMNYHSAIGGKASMSVVTEEERADGWRARDLTHVGSFKRARERL